MSRFLKLFSLIWRRLSRKPVIPDHELLKRIGTGSYGEVWLALSATGRFRAAKVVYRSTFGKNQQHFDREYNGIEQYEEVSHSHTSLMPIYHVGRNPAGDYFYYVMELADHLDGTRSVDLDKYQPKTLAHVLGEEQSRKRIPISECVRIGIELATALDQLHKNELVHRDIKPSNVIFVRGVAKLADIGLVASPGPGKTYVGTQGFIAPEGPGEARADIYALGKLLYEMGMGRDSV